MEAGLYVLAAIAVIVIGWFAIQPLRKNQFVSITTGKKVFLSNLELVKQPLQESDFDDGNVYILHAGKQYVEIGDGRTLVSQPEDAKIFRCHKDNIVSIPTEE